MEGTGNGARDQAALLPPAPGVYRFRDASGKVLYLGRAAHLRSRVASYWADRHALARRAAAVLDRDPAAVAAVTARLVGLRDAASAALAFELAARLQQEMEALDWVTAEQKVTGPHGANHDACGWSDGTLVRFEIRAGRLAGWTVRSCGAAAARPHLAATPPEWTAFAGRNAESRRPPPWLSDKVSPNGAGCACPRSLLLRICEAQQAGFLLHPYRKDWVIAPGPVVTRISIWRMDGLDAGGGTPPPGTVRQDVSWEFTGAQRYDGPVAPPGWRGPGDWEFTGMLTLEELTGDEPFPWRLTSGHVDSLDHVLGYPFLTRDETPGEYRARTGSAVSARPLVRSGSYRLTAGFAEHDHKFGGSATAEVSSDRPPTRAQAQRVAEEAIEAEALRQMAKVYPRWDLKEGDARPSLNRLEVVRLLDVAP